jgi:hypothetical protein
MMARDYASYLRVARLAGQVRLPEVLSEYIEALHYPR